MAITRKNVGGIITIPVKANAVISAGGFVCTDATGYAVPGANTAGLKFMGVAVEGKTATGLSNGDLRIKVYTRGQFKLAATSISQGMVGTVMYINGPATFDDSTSQSIACGVLQQYISNVLGWVDINASGSAAAGVKGDKGDTGVGLIALGDHTTSREENVAGLSSAIALANDLRAKMNAHAADATMHTTAADTVNFPVADDATTLANLKTLVGNLLTAYAAHNADSILTEAWAFHIAQGTTHALVSAVAPTTLQQCVTRLNDLKAKFDLHDADAVSHADDSLHATEVADAAYGAAILVAVAGVQVGDKVFWNIVDDGTGNVTGVSAVAAAGGITFTFSADPQNDAVISYMVARL